MDRAAEIDLEHLQRARLGRARAELQKRDLAACVLVDPVNIRYATGARNMQVFHARNPARYLFLPADGPVILFEFPGCHHLAQALSTIDEIRPATTVSFAAAGPGVEDQARRWAAEIGELVRAHGGGNRRIALERVNYAAAAALAEQGFALFDAQDPVERARAIKLPEEIVCIRASLAAAEEAVAGMLAALRPGISENQLWALLHKSVIEQDGDYVETRLLSSGPHTNPWFQEAGRRAIGAGDLVALDTDVVGRFGYYADFSRTFFCGRGKPTDTQRQLFRLAFEQVQTNLELIRPGMTFRELAAKAWPIPEAYVGNRYFVLAHGVGMTGEYPYILHAQDFASGYDGVIEPNMTLCVESYIGARDGGEGVKLEEQVLVTERGVELISRFPFDEALLGREV
jgi:Xaa-Pro dipeptidase